MLVWFFAIIIAMMRFSPLSRCSRIAPYAEQRKLRLFCFRLLRTLILVKALKELAATLDAPQSAEIKALIVLIRMEHVWVEAWIRYHPDRGTEHVGGISEGDSWVPLDASFKQYAYTQKMDLQDAVPFDAEALLNAA
ncbi:MAG: hypothetical protein LBE85_00535, partial [Candidatus Accumulibacter sp.]|nr:hypothetical protein [Accumulibacter sp.]